MDQTLKDLKKVVLDLMKPQIAELKEPIELLKKFQQGYIDRIINLEEVLRGFIKYKNDWVADVFLHNIDKYVLTKKQKWHLVAQHIHNKKLLEKLDSKVGSARQTVKQPDPFKFCSKCGYSGNVRDIVCPECHNSYFRKTEKKEYKCPICQEKISLDTEFDCPTCESEITLKEMEASGGEKECSVRVGFESPLSEKDEIATDSKLPEPQCNHFGCKKVGIYEFNGIPYCEKHYNDKHPTKKATEPKKFPKVVYQLGSDSKEYVELKKKYDKLIEGFIKFIDHFEERYEGNKYGWCLEYWKAIKEHYKGA